MSKIPVIFKIELAVKESQDKIGIGEKTHRQTRNRPPIPDLLIVYSLRNNHACQSMGNTIHQ
jgi:hypothetical protein